ncbi:MAG TPA: type II toxin-antitoxin system RelE/ParE family toxin [Phycisphaerae bacterium]|nr:type II toxin-antitoxin system RelE/ParE family toxin [Phycisphaerae bacterium]
MKESPYEITATARLDLLQIWNYFAENASTQVADALLSDFESAMEQLTEFPGLGHRREELTVRDVRFYLVNRYFIVYRIDRAPINILRVIYASRNVKKALKRHS